MEEFCDCICFVETTVNEIFLTSNYGELSKQIRNKLRLNESDDFKYALLDKLNKLLTKFELYLLSLDRQSRDVVVKRLFTCRLDWTYYCSYRHFDEYIESFYKSKKEEELGNSEKELIVDFIAAVADFLCWIIGLLLDFNYTEAKLKKLLPEELNDEFFSHYSFIYRREKRVDTTTSENPIMTFIPHHNRKYYDVIKNIFTSRRCNEVAIITEALNSMGLIDVKYGHFSKYVTALKTSFNYEGIGTPQGISKYIREHKDSKYFIEEVNKIKVIIQQEINNLEKKGR